MDSALTKPSEKARAYIELNLRNLSHNVQAVRSILPVRTKIMAVLKANACGHGDVLLADALSREGIEAFAVATLEEAIKLRKAGIRGQILILGYTYPEEIPLLYHYRLSQTVVDVKYARQLNQYGKPIAVHVKIDTGLHRLGEDSRSCRKFTAATIFPFRGLIRSSLLPTALPRRTCFSQSSRQMLSFKLYPQFATAAEIPERFIC